MCNFAFVKQKIKNMTVFKVLITSSFFFIIQNLFATGNFDFSPLARAAYEKAMSLRLSEATTQVAQIRSAEPDNLMACYVDNYVDCLRVFVGEEKSDYSNLKKNEEKRLAILRGGDSNSPYYLFTQAQVQLLWAMNKAKYGDYLDAFNGASTAFEQLEKNQKRFPDFMPNKMSLGVLHAVVGTIPDNYKWGLKLVSGMNGTVEQGQKEIEEVIRYAKTNDFAFEQEAIVMYAFLILHLNNQPESAWTVVNSSKLKPRENMLAAFALSNVAMRTGRNDKAIEILQNRPTGTGYLTFHYMDYMMGLAKMYRGDNDADVYIKRFVTQFKGRNYIKEAYQRLAWQDLLRGSWKDYKGWMLSAETMGRADVGGDKNALKEAKSGIAPEPTLLRARLYFDGGYYQKAYDFLKTKNEGSFTDLSQKLEYSYRMGRILQMLKKPNEAIPYYDKTIQSGKNTKFYFACNAALQLGSIYEASGQKAKAMEFYKYCMALNPDDHADALHAKAKSGLNRVK
jgi:tetratricopeptide (TPR) repeat protein